MEPIRTEHCNCSDSSSVRSAYVSRVTACSTTQWWVAEWKRAERLTIDANVKASQSLIIYIFHISCGSQNVEVRSLSVSRSMCHLHACYILTCFHIKCRNGKDPIKCMFLNKSGENAVCCGVLAPNRWAQTENNWNWCSQFFSQKHVRMESYCMFYDFAGQTDQLQQPVLPPPWR